MSDPFRKAYRQLTDDEHEHVEQIKDAALKLLLLIDTGTRPGEGEKARQIALAITNLEQAVMWATKAHT